MASKTIDDVFAEFQQLPDWNRFPMPEVFYTHFGVKKPKPAEIGEYLNYTPPPAKYEKPQLRLAMPGGVREVPTLEPLPVETIVDTESKPEEWEVVKPEEYATIKDENPAVPGVETPLQRAYSIVSNETKNLPLEVLSVSSPPEPCAAPSTIVFVLPNDAL
jgi:hypothetical protein